MPTQRTPLQLAKITKQRLPDIYHRDRLYKLLDESRGYPAVWINSPAGSGKTTLISGYLERRNISNIWYQTDKGDTDIATFFHYMGLAAGRASSGKQKNPLPHLSAQYPVDTPTFTRRYFEKLFQRIKPGSAIVLDDYQEVDAESDLHEIICQALCAIPDGCRFFILSREAPPAVFARLLVNRMIKNLGWEEIRLTLTETEEIIFHKEGRQLPEAFVTSLHRVTDGWVAGLMMMMISTSAEDKEAGRIHQQKPDEIFDYFTSEVFDTATPEVRDILSKTALFPQMTHQMSEALTGRTRTRRLFPRMHRNHLFIEKRRHRKTVYQFHPLFREFLLHRLTDKYSEEDLNNLRCKAAAILEADGQVEAAVSLLADSGHWDDMAVLIIKHAGSLLSQGRKQSLAKWLGQLPAGLRDENPWLKYWMGTCHLSADPLAAYSCFEKAFDLFRVQGDRTGTLVSWAGVVESVFYRFENMAKVDHWVGILETLLKENRTFPTTDVEARVVFSMFSSIVFCRPNDPKAAFWADRAMALADGSADAGSKAYAYAHLIYYHWTTGHIDRMSAVMESARRIKMTPETDPLIRINIMAIKTVYYLGIRAHDQCLESAFEGLEFARESGVRLRDHMFMGWGAWSALAAGDLETAADLIDRFSACLGHSHYFESSFYHYLRSWEAEIRGDFHQAIHHADLSLEIHRKLGIRINACILLLAKAKAMHGLGRDEAAQHALEEAVCFAEKMKSGIHAYGALALKAEMEFDRGREESARASLQEAMSLGKKHGYFRKILTYPPITARLCARALEAGIEVEYVRKLIRNYELVPDKYVIHTQNWPWPVKVFTLGRFELVIDGKPFVPTGKSPQKLLSFLEALIALGGTEVGKFQIQDALWPDMDGDNADNIFSTSLHRLRKTLGFHKAVMLNRGKVGLNPEYGWVDARAFLNGLEVSDKLREKGDGEGKRWAAQMQAALALYQGPFLPDSDAAWGLPLRERLSNAFVHATNGLGRYYTRTNRIDLAVQCYARALEIDPLLEDFYCSLMGCFARQGNYAQVKRTYLRCRETLMKALAVPPSPKTDAVYRNLS